MKLTQEQIEDKEKLLNMDSTELMNQSININWHEERGAEIWRVWDTYLLFEIPQYGGTSNFVKAYYIKELDNLIKEAYSWT